MKEKPASRVIVELEDGSYAEIHGPLAETIGKKLLTQDRFSYPWWPYTVGSGSLTIPGTSWTSHG